MASPSIAILSVFTGLSGSRTEHNSGYLSFNFSLLSFSRQALLPSLLHESLRPLLKTHSDSKHSFP
nr:hypothetical protein Iba_chr13bCG1100 [Ipomoea batatas]